LFRARYLAWRVDGAWFVTPSQHARCRGERGEACNHGITYHDHAAPRLGLRLPLIEPRWARLLTWGPQALIQHTRTTSSYLHNQSYRMIVISRRFAPFSLRCFGGISGPARVVDDGNQTGVAGHKS
jgi:hypothetical protein